MRPTLRAALATSLLLALPAPTSAQGSICAEGGGSVNGGTWAPGVFGWMVRQGGGPTADVVILGVAGVDAAAEAAFLAAGAQSVAQLAVTQANADLPSTYDAITAADVVWMRGGDQWRYVNWWGGTLTEQAIRDVFANGGVVGGTSAGCAVLGEVIYDARNGTVYPDEGLADPYIQYMTFTTGVFDLTAGALFDTHFTERGRIGRLLAMLARRHTDAGEDLLGIGVDDRTALCIYPDRTAEVRGEGAVTFVHRTAETLERCEPGQPPVLTDVRLHQLTEGYVFDLDARRVVARSPNAVTTPPPQGQPAFQDVVLEGSVLGDEARGDVLVEDGGNDLALFQGALQLLPGTDELLRSVVSTRVWASTAFDENRVGGPQYALAANPHFLALLLDDGVRVDASRTGYLTVLPPAGTPTALVVLDGHGTQSHAFSTYLSSGSAVGPRQSVALEGATYHVLREGWTYDALAHAPLAAPSYGQGKVTSDGLVPRLASEGTPSLEVDTFALRVRDARPNSPALLFRGPAPDAQPFRGGTLWVAPPFTRVTTQFLDPQGATEYDLPIDPRSVGTTQHYQVWFRDVVHPDGTGVGLTNGVRAEIRP